MKLHTCILLTLVNCCLASEFSMSQSCDNIPAVGDQPDIKRRDGIVGALQEGIELAEKAYDTMQNHGTDEYVQKMCKIVLGDDDFQTKFEHAKSTFEGVKAFKKEPSQFKPKEKGWLDYRTNIDLEIYCDSARMVPHPQFQGYTDTAQNKHVFSFQKKDMDKDCYNPSFVIGSGQQMVKAMTRSSDAFDLARWTKDGKPLDRSPYQSETDYANTMDICTWFWKKADQEGWPKIDDERIKTVMSEDFELRNDDSPIDALKTIGSTMLHELTHTNQGGKTIDMEVLPPGVESCYKWKCIIQLKSAINADSIAMLGMALEAWDLGYHVDEDGKILERPKA